MSDLIPEGWRFNKLSDICDIVGGGTPERLKKEYWKGSIPWISPTEITGLKSRYIAKSKEKITQLGLEKSSAKLHPVGTVLMTSRASIGYVAINTIPVTTNQGFQSLQCKSEIYNEYLYQHISWIRPELEKLSAGSTFSEISSTSLKSLELIYPPLPEQQKIAAILTSVDEVIEKTQAQCDKLKDLKTAMMQELLTKGVGIDGNLRTEFKDSPVGRIPKGWGVVKLLDTGKWKGGGTPSKLNENYWSGSIPWVSPKDMKLDLISRTVDNITEDAIKGSSTNLITKNSLLMVVRSGILKHTLPVAIAGCDLTVNQDMKALSVSENYCVNFILYYLQANNHRVLRATLKAGNTVESIDFNEFGKFLIPSPPIDEQIKISKIVAAISTKMKRKELKLDALKKIKKALMQDLLTGKVRVTVPTPSSTKAS